MNHDRALEVRGISACLCRSRNIGRPGAESRRRALSRGAVPFSAQAGKKASAIRRMDGGAESHRHSGARVVRASPTGRRPEAVVISVRPVGVGSAPVDRHTRLQRVTEPFFRVRRRLGRGCYWPSRPSVYRTVYKPLFWLAKYAARSSRSWSLRAAANPVMMGFLRLPVL